MIRSGKERYHTLSGRLVMLFIGMTILILIITGLFIGVSFRTHFQENIRPHLTQYLNYIQNDLGSPPDREKALALANRLNVEIHYKGKDQQWSSNHSQLNLADINYQQQFVQQDIEYGFGYVDDREYLISRHPDYTLAFSIPLHDKSSLKRFIPLLAIMISLVFLYHFTKRLFSPVKIIKEGVALIGAGDLGHRLKITRRNELGELADSINKMADDIEQMLEAKRQLLLAISHELRSPLTRAKVACAMIDEQSQQSEIERELNEMEALIEEILETERLSSRHHILNRSATVIQSLIEELVEQYFPDQLITIEMPDELITVMVDSARIKLLLKNIIGNALQHNPSDSKPPVVRLQKKDMSIIFTIQDFGAGIDAEHLPHLMEPFYRTDASRQRQTGGYGLGLYLCKVIAEAHAGKLNIFSKPEEGTRVVVEIPQ